MSSRQYVKYKTKSRPRRLGNVMSPALPAIGDVIVEKPRKSTFTLSGSKFNKYYNKKSSGYPMAMPTGYRQRTYRKFTPKVKSKVDKKNEALDFFDATKNTEHTLPLPNSLGVSVPLNFSSRYSPSTSTTANTHVYYIIQFTDSQCVGAFYSMVGTTATAVASLTPLLFTDLDTNPPTSFRASRLTATLLNTTSITNVAGSVSALYLMNGLEWEFDATLFSISAALQNEIRTMIESNSKSKIFSASNFVGDSVKNKFSLVPTSMANLENWLTYGNSQSSVALQKATLINGAQHFTHSTLILRFENTSVANTYTLLLNGQYSTRYPANSILTSIARKDLYPKKELVEEHSKILDSEGYHGLLNGGISWDEEPSYQIITDKQQYKYTVDEGLKKAYNNLNNHFYDYENKVLYIAGTKWFNERGNITFNDALTDAVIPLNMLEFTPRYRQAEQLYKLYKPDIIVGHSLSGMIGKKLNEKYGVNYRSYGAPLISIGDKQYERRRHIGDPISVFDRKARIIGGVMDNPHTYQGYRNF